MNIISQKLPGTSQVTQTQTDLQTHTHLLMVKDVFDWVPNARITQKPACFPKRREIIKVPGS